MHNRSNPLAKLVLKSAAKFNLSSEAAALLIVQGASAVIRESIPHLQEFSTPEFEKTVKITYKKETLFLHSRNSALSAELNMRRQSLLEALRKRVPHIPCKYVVVLGAKK